MSIPELVTVVAGLEAGISPHHLNQRKIQERSGPQREVAHVHQVLKINNSCVAQWCLFFFLNTCSTTFLSIYYFINGKEEVKIAFISLCFNLAWPPRGLMALTKDIKSRDK